MSNKFANGKDKLRYINELTRNDVGKQIKITQGIKDYDPNPLVFIGTLTNIYTRGLEIKMENGEIKTILISPSLYDYEITIPTTELFMEDSEDKENVPRNIAKPFDAMRNTEDVIDARTKNRTSLKTSMDELTERNIGNLLTVTETSKYNKRNTKSYTGTLNGVSTDDYGKVGYINILDSGGREKTISNLGDSYNYTVELLSKGGLKKSLKKRKGFSRKRNKKSLKKRKTKRTLRYKR